MANLELAVLFRAIDDMSGKIDRISKSFTGLDNQISRTERGKALISALIAALVT